MKDECLMCCKIQIFIFQYILRHYLKRRVLEFRVYTSKDTEIMYAPFDGMSELVTVETIQDLISVLIDFKNNSLALIFSWTKKVMGKYIGPLTEIIFKGTLNIYNMLSIDMNS